jgi:hypothetical protein
MTLRPEAGGFSVREIAAGIAYYLPARGVPRSQATEESYMVSRRIISSIAAIVILLAAQAAGADATLIVQGSDGLKSMIQLRGGKGKMSAAGTEEYVVYDAGTGTIAYVDPAQRQYTQMTAAELQSGLETAAGIRETVAPYMADMLAGLPPEQRRMIEQRMGAFPGAPAAGSKSQADQVKIVARGSHMIAGLQCKASGILKNGRPAAEVCMATAPSGKLSRQDFETLQAMVAFSRSLAGSAGSMLGDQAKLFDFMITDIDGVPVAVRDLVSGKRYEVTAVSDATLSDGLFNGYGGFQRQELPGILRQP